MKKIAIFGVGYVGKQVLDILGNEQVCFFISNNPEETSFNGVPVIRFEEYLKHSCDVYVMIASTKYAQEMKEQLRNSGIANYFEWNDDFLNLFSGENMGGISKYNPVYSGDEWNSISYPIVRAFLKFDLGKYKNICIYVYSETVALLIQLMRMVGKLSDVISVIHQGECESSIFNAIRDKTDCMICAVRRDDNNICDIYEHIAGFDVVDLYDIAGFLPEMHSKKALKYKDKYKGQRCFILGNGPSLQIDDLNKIEENGDITFACNKIHKLFPETTWRPDFYFITDVWVLKSEAKEILNIEPKECSFYNYGFCNGYILWNNDDKVVPLYHMPEQPSTDRLPRFSKDISIHHCNGSSVSYTMLQTAFYMGFETVYLIGFNHFVESLEKTHDVEHFYDSSDDAVWDLVAEYTKIDNHIKLNNAYKSAKLAYEEDGRHIYNATRGGHLEIFERVDFDSLF